MNCPLYYPNKEWCIDCKFAKEGLCDYPCNIMRLIPNAIRNDEERDDGCVFL